MADFAMDRPGVTWFVGVAWQSGVLLLLGLAASAVVRRRPARAHRILLLAMVGAIVAPLGSQLARSQGWGLWTSVPADRPGISGSSAIAPSVVASSPGLRTGGLRPERRAEKRTEPTAAAIATSTAATPTVPERPATRAGASISIGGVLLASWGLLSGLCLARLAAAMVAGRRVIGRARPVADEEMARAAHIAAVRLALQADPLLRESSRVACPAIWCWGRRPVIVLPEATTRTSPSRAANGRLAHGVRPGGQARASTPPDPPFARGGKETGGPPYVSPPYEGGGRGGSGACKASVRRPSVDWAGVFCHELAHWVRKDHWSGLFAEFLVCLLPWNPMAWWARRRMGQLSELACDDWALATGVPAGVYAEALLSLVPQTRTGLALSAVSSRRGLVGRVRHILDERRIVPAVGRRWTFASATIVALAACAIALSQTRPAAPKDEKPAVDRPASSSAPSNSAAPRRVIRGQILKPDGSPAVGAHVLSIGSRKDELPITALPRSQRANPKRYDETLVDTHADATGRFEIAADFDPDLYFHEEGFAVNLLAALPGAGLLAPRIGDDANEVALRLPPQVMIRGRLLTPSGSPAAGVRVALETILDGETDGMGVDADLPDDLIPSYWPRPHTTDADGRFTIEGVPEGTFAQIKLQHPDYAIEEVTVNAVTRGEINKALSGWTKGFEIVPVKPDFTHTLEPARPVQGRVTDKGTSKPLAGILVEMIPMRRHGGMPFYARTDADGRYRVSGHQGESYGTTVYPAPESGYLPVQDLGAGWPSGARFLEKNFALVRGKIVHGRVIDAGTNRPIAGAAVVYRPERDHPGTDRTSNFDNPVVSDAEGRFAITTLPGAGILAAETTDAHYMRTPIDDDGTYGNAFPQGVATIDVPRVGEPPPAEILVRKGVTLQVRVLDPEGKPARGTIVTCEGIDARLMDVWNVGQPVATGVFRLHGADPSRTYRVFFIHPERKLGAFLDVKPGPEGSKPVEVRLRPTAKFHGKIVNSGGSPVPAGQVYPAIAPDDRNRKMSREELLSKLERVQYFDLLGQRAMNDYMVLFQTNARGEFAIDTLLPGMDFYVMVSSTQGAALAPVPPLKPGEDRDLGTITVGEED